MSRAVFGRGCRDAAARIATIVQPCRLQNREPRGIEMRLRLREWKLDALMRADRLSPDAAFLRMLNRPIDQPEEVSVRPGLHAPQAGSHEVVWFDPRALALRAAKTEGVENEQVLSGSTEQAVEGMRRYEEWRDRRTQRIEAGSAPRYVVSTAESSKWIEEADAIEVATVTLPAAPGRPSGRKFGRLVHDILQHAERAEEVDALAAIWGRRHAAGESECAAAAEAARATLEYLAREMPEGARRYRELPVLVRLADGSLVDGRIDFAWSDGTQWTVADYKTDRRESRNVAQVQLYGLALQRATGLPVRGIVIEV